MNYDTFDTYAVLIGAEAAYHRLLSGDTTPGLLDVVVAKDPSWAYLYALEIIRGPWPMGEPAIAQDAMWAYYYARDVIKGPWPAGEPAIAQDSGWAYLYALHIIQGPWPETGIK